MELNIIWKIEKLKKRLCIEVSSSDNLKVDCMLL